MALTDKLRAIGDQVRRISKTEDAMTLDQMATNLLNVVPGGGLPSAEESSFGVAADTETGIKNLGDVSTSTSTSLFTTGWEFTATEAFSIIGFRQMQNNPNYKYMILWDSAGNAVARIDTSDQATEWKSYYLDNPINVAIGETYTITVCTSGLSFAKPDGTTFNGKLGDIQLVYATNNKFPTSKEYSVALVDIIISSVAAELPDSYEIQRTTMDDIAEELQRISGTTGKMNTAQIITALQGIAVQTTE